MSIGEPAASEFRQEALCYLIARFGYIDDGAAQEGRRLDQFKDIFQLDGH